MTYAWKDELEKKAYNAISKALGQNAVVQSQEKHKEIGMEDDQVSYSTEINKTCNDYFC